MVALAIAAAAAGAAATTALLAPHMIASFISRTFRIMLRDESFCADVREKLVEMYTSIDDKVMADKLLGPTMNANLQQTMVAVMGRDDVHEACIRMADGMVKNQALAETIRKGVLEALRNDALQLQLKEMLIQDLQDDELQACLTRILLQTVKAGIRDAIEDVELRMVIVAAIRESLEDPRMTGVIKTALTDVLADKDVHRATLQGAVASMNPLEPLREQMRRTGSQRRASPGSCS
mmetsp:Transcript_19201/g.44861  ORF Transcript_19201/g.44861 Transcript_19201/m.44861 type:complete len:236 (-) Transcript_19201:76-783(-)